MTYEYHLKRKNSSWRPGFVRNDNNFANVIANYRNKYAKAPHYSAEERQIVANFNKAYSAWMSKVKNENTKRRAAELSLFRNLKEAKKSGNAAAVNAVLARYANGGKSPVKSVVAAVRRRTPVARSASPKRSGKRRNTGNLRMMMAHRNLTRLKANLMTEKAALERERNNLETKIFAIIRKIGELPNN